VAAEAIGCHLTTDSAFLSIIKYLWFAFLGAGDRYPDRVVLRFWQIR
jgi:hypothetical protein